MLKKLVDSVAKHMTPDAHENVLYSDGVDSYCVKTSEDNEPAMHYGIASFKSLRWISTFTQN